MRIQLDDQYILNSDALSYWISKRTLTDKGTERIERCSGYCATFGQAVNSFIEAGIRKSQARDFDDLKDDVYTLIKMVESWEVVTK